MPVNRSLLMVAALALSVATTPAIASTSACDAVSGNLITNCGFEAGSFLGWTQGGDKSFTFVAPPVPANYFVNSGVYAAGLGPVNLGSLTSNTFSDTAGGKYSLSFFLYGDILATSGSFAALLDGSTTLIPQFADSTNAYQEYVTTFIGTGSDSIEFLFKDGNGTYMFLDDVVVAATPEPSSLVLLGTGVLGLAGMARRKLLDA